MNLLYLSPRLDVPFKNFGPVSEERGPISPLRQNWVNFKEGLKKYCELKKHNLVIHENPLWAFNPDDYKTIKDIDYIIVPHKEKHNFSIEGQKCLYLMQAPFPEYFSLDTEGWAGNLSYLPYLDNIMIDANKMDNIWDKFRIRVLGNVSKFDQPTKQINQENFVLFICQLPHDETIKYHSDISVADALTLTIATCKTLGLPLIVKGHPANPDSMTELKAIAEKFGVTWVDDVSIHSCIKKSTHCVTVNSGAGLEVIMHKKPIFTFGRSEYDSVAHKKSLLNYLSYNYYDSYDMEFEEVYKQFIYRYMYELIDPLYIPSYENVFRRILEA